MQDDERKEFPKVSRVAGIPFGVSVTILFHRKWKRFQGFARNDNTGGTAVS